MSGLPLGSGGGPSAGRNGRSARPLAPVGAGSHVGKHVFGPVQQSTVCQEGHRVALKCDLPVQHCFLRRQPSEGNGHRSAPVLAEHDVGSVAALE